MERPVKQKTIGYDRFSSISSIGVRVVHPFKENLAFGRLLVPVLARKIRDPDPIFRKRAMNSLRDVLYDPKNAFCLNEDDEVPNSFMKLAMNSDHEIRKLLAEIILALTSSSVGREYFLKKQLMKQAFLLLADEDDTIRNITCKALKQVCVSPVGVETMVLAGVTARLFSRLLSEPMVNQEEALQVLHRCTKIAPRDAIEAEGISILLKLLKSYCTKVRQYAALVLLEIGVDKTRGRPEIVNLRGIPALLELCHLDEETSVVGSALGALMVLVNCTSGKKTAIENSAVAKLLPLLRIRDVTVRMNCLRVLTALAETPIGRRLLQQNVGQISLLKTDGSPEVQRAARKAICVIEAVSL